MTLLSLVEDRPTPPQVYNWRVYLLATVASFASCMIGYDSAFIGQTVELTSFREEFHFGEWPEDKQNLVKANIVSLYQAGAFFGALFAYPIGFYCGRKWGLFITTLVFTLGSGLMLGANGSRGLGIMYAGRVLAGMGVGSGSNLTPIYISELSPPAIRGRLVGIYELGWQIGGLVGFWINFGVSETLPESRKQWIIPFAVQLIPSGLLLMGVLFIRESPRWLFGRGRRQEAIANLCWIRQLPETEIYITEEIIAIDQALEEQNAEIGTGFWKPFQAAATKPRVMWRLFLGFTLFFWQNCSGINAINYYSPTVFRSLGITGSLNQMMSGIFGVVKTVVTFLWLLVLIDHVGRRQLLIAGGIGGSVCMWIIGAYTKIKDPENNPSADLDSAGIMAIVFFYIYTATFSPTWNGTPWVLNSEMFDPNMRSLAQSVASSSNWLWNFLISRFTPQMFAQMQYGVYFFFASLMLFSIVFVFFLIPETKGVPLELMDRLFEIKPTWHAHGRIMGQLREEEVQLRREIQGSDLYDAKAKEEFLEDA
ncbi:general substrate transporter [Aspergillus unguis]